MNEDICRNVCMNEDINIQECLYEWGYMQECLYEWGYKYTGMFVWMRIYTGMFLLTETFKGAVSRDFLSFFLFHESKPSGPGIYRLKWFCLEIRFREDICEICDSAQANTAQSRKFKCLQIQNWLTLHGVKLFFSIFENLHFQGI